MPRIAGINIPEEKRIEIALTYIYGIGRSLSTRILEKLKINKDQKAKELDSAQVNMIKDEILKHYRVEGELRHDINLNIKRHKEIGTYRGLRHARSLPVRGQQTRTNSRTVRGNVRRTMGSGKTTVEKT
ncbi:MAG: 30S ribosomal protein S13 [Candidatus Moranbacteria bacterium]|nr:30S ribosomal protein S13 [Candidatus Moranbacteria bacterium]